LSYASTISVKNALTDPVTLTFQPQIHVSSSVSQGHYLYQVWKLWDHYFLVMLQTNRWTRNSYQRQQSRRG